MLKVGERALALARLFNAREGFTAADDTLPERLYKGVSTGPLKDKGIDKAAMAEAIEMYYEMAGWDPAVMRFGRRSSETVKMTRVLC